MVKQMVTRSQTRKAGEIIHRMVYNLREASRHSSRCSRVHDCVEMALTCIYQLGKMAWVFTQEQQDQLGPLLRIAIPNFVLFAEREIATYPNAHELVWEMDRVCRMRSAFYFLIHDGQYDRMIAYPPPFAQVHPPLGEFLEVELRRKIDWSAYNSRFHEPEVRWWEWIVFHRAREVKWL